MLMSPRNVHSRAGAAEKDLQRYRLFIIFLYIFLFFKFVFILNRSDVKVLFVIYFDRTRSK